MLLRHLHLPGITPYSLASALQTRLVSAILASKAASSNAGAGAGAGAGAAAAAATALPPPTVLTAQFQPIYTTGLRDLASPSAEQVARLRSTGADFHAANRGGLTTFHGPGQLVAYPILDLRRHFPARQNNGIGARDYVGLLERTVSDTLDTYGIRSMTLCEAPGVWVTRDRKICAVGVHMRRHVTSHGIALNVHTDLAWFDHIVACGLEGKETTSMRREGANVQGGVEAVAAVFVEKLAGAMGVETVEKLRLEDMPEA